MLQLNNKRIAEVDSKTTGHVRYYARFLTLSSKGEQTQKGLAYIKLCVCVKFKENCDGSLYAGKNQLLPEITISKTVNVYRFKYILIWK